MCECTRNRRNTQGNCERRLQSHNEWGAPSTETWKISKTRFQNLLKLLRNAPESQRYPGRIFFHFVNPFSNDFRRGIQPDSRNPKKYEDKEHLKTEPNYETRTWGQKRRCHSNIIEHLKKNDVVFGVARIRYGNHDFLKEPERDRTEHFLTWVLSVDQIKCKRKAELGKKDWYAFVFREDASFLCLPPKMRMNTEMLERLSEASGNQENPFARFLKEWRRQRQRDKPQKYYSTYANAFAQYFHGGPKLNKTQINALLKTIKKTYAV